MCVAGLHDYSRRDRTYLWKTINTILSTINNYCTTRVGGCVDKYHNRYRDRNVYEMLKLLLSYCGKLVTKHVPQGNPPENRFVDHLRACWL